MCFKNVKKTEQCQKTRLEDSQGPRNVRNGQHGSHLLYPNIYLPDQLLLSSELGRFEDWQAKFPKNRANSMVLYCVGACWKCGIDPEKSVVFVSYLRAQVDYRVHILQFRSTHQYCRTAKYEPDRTIGCEDR